MRNLQHTARDPARKHNEARPAACATMSPTSTALNYRHLIDRPQPAEDTGPSQGVTDHRASRGTDALARRGTRVAGDPFRDRVEGACVARSRVYIVVAHTMFLRLLLAACLVSLNAAPSYADARGDAKAQVEFGVDVAQKGLWREAIYRWERAIAIDPTYAAAFNNLAVAYEHEGQFEKARVAYEKATELEPNNAMLRQNYDLFKEINDRTNRSSAK
jgi:tetratricopeptide (TPR) repeat protein